MTLLVWLGAAFVLGLWTSRWWEHGPGAALMLSLAAAACGLLARSFGVRGALVGLMLAAALLGAARGGPEALTASGDLVFSHGIRAAVSGEVAAMPEVHGPRIRIIVDAASVSAGRAEWQAEGRFVAWVEGAPTPVPGRAYPFIARGDRISVRGTLDTPEAFEGFDYPEHLASQDIGSVMSGAEVMAHEPRSAPWLSFRTLDGARARLAAAAREAVPAPAGALAAALAFGVRGGMPPDAANAFRRSGTAHVLAISGLHVGLVLGASLVAAAAAAGRRRQLYLLAPLIATWGYVALAGAPVSALRAAIMASVVLLAYATGRAPRPLTALAFAAAALLAYDPAMLWNRSFQLSFTAMAGVLFVGLPAWEAAQAHWPILAPKRDAPWARRLLRWAAAALLVSAGATAGALPLVAFNFGRVAMLGWAATLLMLPALPVLIIGGIATGALALLWAPLGWSVAWLPAAAGWWTILVARAFNALPGASLSVGAVEAAWVWGYYAALAALLALSRRKTWLQSARRAVATTWRGPRQGRGALALVLAATLLAAAPWTIGAARDDDLLHVRFLDVGQGDAALVTLPSGASVLIDGGPDPRVLEALIDGVLPSRNPTIDVAVITHGDADHRNGVMGLARRGSVGQFIVPPAVPGEEGAWRAELESLDVQASALTAGAEITLPDGARLQVLHPPSPPMLGTQSDVNNNSMVLRLVYSEASVLFAADIEHLAEALLVESGAPLRSDVLKAPHHGSGTSTSPEFLTAVAPVIAVISAGQANPFGHPAPEVVTALERQTGPGRTFITAQHGPIELATDGHDWWVVKGGGR
ncbi:MAG: DNA internalization-related competence protein ComEC/Rec2 [Dehalococcoidia bacterium]|nr:DNA internalization-related competence protein ComEC/Rec2 [Dehalococcoidia bacterium]